jgi:hypothetical protein
MQLVSLQQATLMAPWLVDPALVLQTVQRPPVLQLVPLLTLAVSIQRQHRLLVV